MRAFVAAVILLSATCVLAQTGASAACSKVATLALSNVAIESATLVAPGTFAPAGAKPTTRAAKTFSDAPEFCRVIAHGRPTPDSDIVIEVWLPTSNWNGRFQGIGTGGFAGVIPYPSMAASVSRG